MGNENEKQITEQKEELNENSNKEDKNEEQNPGNMKSIENQEGKEEIKKEIVGGNESNNSVYQKPINSNRNEQDVPIKNHKNSSRPSFQDSRAQYQGPNAFFGPTAFNQGNQAQSDIRRTRSIALSVGSRAGKSTTQIELEQSEFNKVNIKIPLSNGQFWAKEYKLSDTVEMVVKDFRKEQNQEIPDIFVADWNCNNMKIEMQDKLRDIFKIHYEVPTVELGYNKRLAPLKISEPTSLSEYIARPLQEPFEIYKFSKEKKDFEILPPGESIVRDKELDDFDNKFGAYCNGDNHLFLSGPSDKYWDVDLTDNQISDPLHLPEPKQKHSMIFIPPKYVFIVGGEDRRTYYVDNEKRQVFNWGDLNKTRIEPSLILVGDDLYCFDNAKTMDEAITIEKTNLTDGLAEWQLIDPMISNDIRNPESIQKFFGISKDLDNNIVFLGGDKEDENDLVNYKYNIKENEIQPSQLKYKKINFQEKTFLPLTETKDYILPDFTRESPALVIYNKQKGKIDYANWSKEQDTKSENSAKQFLHHSYNLNQPQFSKPAEQVEIPEISGKELTKSAVEQPKDMTSVKDLLASQVFLKNKKEETEPPEKEEKEEKEEEVIKLKMVPVTEAVKEPEITPEEAKEPEMTPALKEETESRNGVSFPRVRSSINNSYIIPEKKKDDIQVLYASQVFLEERPKLKQVTPKGPKLDDDIKGRTEPIYTNIRTGIIDPYHKFSTTSDGIKVPYNIGFEPVNIINDTDRGKNTTLRQILEDQPNTSSNIYKPYYDSEYDKYIIHIQPRNYGGLDEIKEDKEEEPMVTLRDILDQKPLPSVYKPPVKIYENEGIIEEERLKKYKNPRLTQIIEERGVRKASISTSKIDNESKRSEIYVKNTIKPQTTLRDILNDVYNPEYKLVPPKVYEDRGVIDAYILPELGLDKKSWKSYSTVPEKGDSRIAYQIITLRDILETKYEKPVDYKPRSSIKEDISYGEIDKYVVPDLNYDSTNKKRPSLPSSKIDNSVQKLKAKPVNIEPLPSNRRSEYGVIPEYTQNIPTVNYKTGLITPYDLENKNDQIQTINAPLINYEAVELVEDTRPLDKPYCVRCPHCNQCFLMYHPICRNPEKEALNLKNK